MHCKLTFGIISMVNLEVDFVNMRLTLTYTWKTGLKSRSSSELEYDFLNT